MGELVDVVRDAITGELRVRPFEGSKRRMSICRECDRLSKVLNRCKECGCFMDAKTKISGTRCPLGKW